MIPHSGCETRRENGDHAERKKECDVQVGLFISFQSVQPACPTREPNKRARALFSHTHECKGWQDCSLIPCETAKGVEAYCSSIPSSDERT